MNYYKVPPEQLRKERVRLTNMLQLLQQRRDSSVAHRGGREAGFRRGGTTHQQEREIQRLTAQLAELDAELVRQDQRAKAAANSDTPATPETAASDV